MGEPFSYTNWAPGQPDNFYPDENRLHFFAFGTAPGQTWNDAGEGAPYPGYIFETNCPPCLDAQGEPITLTPYPNDPYPFDTTNLNDATRTASVCFVAEVTSAGGEVISESGYRPLDYQLHLRDVYDKWVLLMNNKKCGCAQIKEAMRREFEDVHHLHLSSDPNYHPSGRTKGGGQHPQGNALDLSVIGNVDRGAVAAFCHLCRRYPKTDPSHYETWPPMVPCPGNSFPKPAASRARVPIDSPFITVSVRRTEEPGRITYRYAVANNSPDSLTSIELGYNALDDSPDAEPQLAEYPIGWTAEVGIPSGSATAPPGWVVAAIPMEESNFISMAWTLDSLGTALAPGHVLTGMSVTIASVNNAYEYSTEWTAYLNSDSTTAVIGSLPTPVGVEELRPESGLALRIANPSQGTARIDYNVPARQATRLEIFDVAGRRVRLVFDDVAGPGPGFLTWDGRSEQGTNVPNGIYIARLVSGGESLSRKFVLAR